jgi:hypothetical protein
LKKVPSNGPVEPASTDITAQATVENKVLRSVPAFWLTVFSTASIARSMLMPWSPSPTAASKRDSISWRVRILPAAASSIWHISE